MRHLRLLGPTRVEHIDTNPEGGKGDAGSIPRFRSQRAVALLGYLTAERRTIAREYLAVLLWPDEAPGKGRSKLRRELYNLTKILPGCWETDAQTVRFHPAAHTSVDIYVLQRMETERRWQEAADLLGGEFLEGLYLSDNLEFETWLLAERERWRERSRVILASAREQLTRHGRYADALLYGQRLLQLAPWDEEANRQVMRLLAWTGQREAALRQFGVNEQVLVEQLGVEPSRETVDLLRQIQERELKIPATPPAFLTEKKARRDDSHSLIVARERELAWLNRALDSALAGQGGLVFLTGGPGRGKTVLMDAFARQAIMAHPNLLVASGNCDAGAADPYLPFRDMMAMLTGDVEARWSAGAISSENARRLWEAMPNIVQALLEHGPHLMPILLSGTALLNRATAAEPAGAPWLPKLRGQVQGFQGKTADLEQSHLFEQFTNMLRAVAEKQPILLLLDDLQWASAASAGLLFHLGRRLSKSGSRILIVCAYRPEEIIRDLRGGRHMLAKVLGEFRRIFGEVWLSLSWADETGGRRFVDAVVDSEPNRLGQEFRTDLFQRTGGHPLFTVELLRTLRGRGDLIKDADGSWSEGPALDWQVLPARIEAVIEERIGRLEVELRQILAVASVEGENFTAEVVARVQGLSQRQLLGYLSQKLEKHHRLVREREQVKAGQQLLSRYRFAHVLFQRYLYDSLSAGERRLLHGEIARALEALYEGQTDEKASQLAHHFREAGRREKAIEFSRLAAQRAKAVYAYDEAIQHLQTALDLLESGERVETQMGLLEELADVHSLLRKDAQAISLYQAALEQWSSLSGGDKMIAVRLHRKILQTVWRMKWFVEYDQYEAMFETQAASRAYLESNLDLVERESPQLEVVHVLTTLANDAGIRSPEDLDTAEGYAQAAVNLAEQLDAPVELSAAFQLLAYVYFARGHLPKQLKALRQALSLSRDPRSGDTRRRIKILVDLSGALRLVGRYDQAIPYLSEAESLAVQIGAVDRHVQVLSSQALCWFRLDRWDELFRVDERRRDLEKRYTPDQIGSSCLEIAFAAAALALKGDLEQARVLREQAYAIMVRSAGGSPENWGRNHHY